MLVDFENKVTFHFRQKCDCLISMENSPPPYSLNGWYLKGSKSFIKKLVCFLQCKGKTTKVQIYKWNIIL